MTSISSIQWTNLRHEWNCWQQTGIFLTWTVDVDSKFFTNWLIFDWKYEWSNRKITITSRHFPRKKLFSLGKLQSDCRREKASKSCCSDSYIIGYRIQVIFKFFRKHKINFLFSLQISVPWTLSLAFQKEIYDFNTNPVRNFWDSW